jgi:flagellar assembly protein FliH
VTSELFDFPVLEGTAAARTAATAAERAAQVVAAAEAEAARIREDAAAAGREEGRALGIAQAEAALAPATETLGRAAEAVAATAAEQADTVERRAVELAVVLAGRIVDAALAVRPELVLDVIAGTLRMVVERDRIVLDVHPDDAELVRASAEALAGPLGGAGRFEVRADPAVSRGGCIVRTVEGEIDGRIDSQLARAAEIARLAMGREG